MEWISVEDSLPEPGQKVAIATFSKDKHYMSRGGNWLKVVDENYAYPVWTPTHWIPLPDPPEVDDAD